jgi:hypothetical protein
MLRLASTRNARRFGGRIALNVKAVWIMTA